MPRRVSPVAGPLRVAIDAHMVGEQETGNETYIVNLVRGLAAVDHDTSYLLYSPHPESLDLCGDLPPNFIRRRIRPGASALRIPFGMPAQVLADRADILHVTYVAPPVTSAQVVVTVHDISYLLFPEAFSPRDRRILGTLVPRTMRRAAAVVTVSECSRRDIIEHYGIPEAKIHVTFEAIAPSYRRLPEVEVARVRARYGVAGAYIMALGNLQPRKNLPRLIGAFARLRGSGAYNGQLVLVGKSKWQESAIYAEARSLGVEQEIIFTGYIPEDDVVALLNGADVFVYPSLYEGFGLPPLEAMACGCPVVTANTSSLPEVVGDAGLMVDPASEEAFADAIAQITRDQELRRALTERGLAQVKRFTNETTAQATRAVYAQVAQRHQRAPHAPLDGRAARTDEAARTRSVRTRSG